MAETAGRRTQAERRMTTEQRLLDAATRLFAARGSRSVSIADVGEAAGYSRGIVTQHFGGKPQLLAAVVVHAQQFEVPTPDDGTGLDRLAALVRAYLRNLDAGAPRGQAFLMLWAEAIAADPVLAPLFAERDTWFRRLLAERGRARGGARGRRGPRAPPPPGGGGGGAPGPRRAPGPPDAAAVTIFATLRGIGLQRMASGRHIALGRLGDEAVAVLTRGLAA